MLKPFLNTYIIISYGMYPIICIQNNFIITLNLIGIAQYDAI